MLGRLTSRHGEGVIFGGGGDREEEGGRGR